MPFRRRSMNAILQMPVLEQDQDIAFTYWMKNVAENEFVVTAFAVDEAIFGMTRIEVMLASKNDAIDLQSLIDTAGTLTVHHKYIETLRHFSGIVVEAERGDRGHHRTAYRLILMPSLYRLDQGSDCRIFQQKSVPDIVKELFSEYKIENVVWNLNSQHLAREYCVQYRESHLAFIERILSEEGIFYFFDHNEQGLLKLTLTDQSMIAVECPGMAELEYNATSSGAVKGVYCSSFSYREKLRTTTVIQRDYTFKKPEYNQQHKEKATLTSGEKQDYELYDYPGRYKEDAAGKAFTRHKLEATRVDANLSYGVANAPHLITGHSFTLNGHPDKKLNRKWRVLTVRHEGVQPQVLSEDAQGTPLTDTGLVAPALAGTALAGLSFGVTGSKSLYLLSQMFSRGVNLALHSSNGKEAGGKEAGQATLYANAFSAQPASQPYRPPQEVKPLVDGPQIATIVGPPGKEIYTDKYGRIKVHFPWDRHKDPKDEDSSCWIRVASGWAGGQWGQISIPRIGHEVIVDFLEGDPDQPIVVGRTYHETNQPPYDLPENKTKMVVRSDTHKGEGFNEISFEDESGQENIYVHAQRNMDTHVEHNDTMRVDVNQALSVGHNKKIEIGNHEVEFIGGNNLLWVGIYPRREATRKKWPPFTKDLTKIGEVIPEIMDHASNMVNDSKNNIDNNVSNAIQGAMGVGNNMPSAQMSDMMHEMSASIPNNLSDNSSDAAEEGSNLTKEASAKVKDTVTSAKDTLKAASDDAKSVIDSMGDHAEAGSAGGNRLVNVVNNQLEIVGITSTEMVGLNSNEIVGGLKTVTVGGVQNEIIGLNSNEMIGGGKVKAVVGTDITAVGAAKITTVGGTHALAVG